MLRIRKTLGSLLFFVLYLCSKPQAFIESGAWLKIVKLSSLAEMNRLLPDEYLDVRNLFQILLIEALSPLESALKQAKPYLNEKILKTVESEILPF